MIRGIHKLHIANNASGILYASTSLDPEKGFKLLQRAVDALLASVDVSPKPDVLWSVIYQQYASSGTERILAESEHALNFPPPSMDLAFDDAIFDNVKEMWQKIMGEDSGDFLVFQDREQYDDDK